MSLSRVWTQQIGCTLASLTTVGRYLEIPWTHVACLWTPVAVKAAGAAYSVSSPSSFPEPFPLSSDSVFTYSESQVTGLFSRVTLRTVVVREGEVIYKHRSLWNAGRATQQCRHCDGTKYISGWSYPNRCSTLGMKQSLPRASHRHGCPESAIITTPLIWKAFSKHLLYARDGDCRGRSQSLLVRCSGETDTIQWWHNVIIGTMAVRTTGTWIKSYGLGGGTDSFRSQHTMAHGPNLPVSTWMTVMVCVFSNYWGKKFNLLWHMDIMWNSNFSPHV